MIMDNTNAGSKLNAVFKYSENDATMSILSLHRDMGLTFDIDLILPLSNSLNYSYLFFELIDNHFVSNL
jgi:hypothetical protein